VEDAERDSDGDTGEVMKEEEHEHVEVGLSTDLLFILVTMMWTKLVMKAKD
jgi:hypothetical protein